MGWVTVGTNGGGISGEEIGVQATKEIMTRGNVTIVFGIQRSIQNFTFFLFPSSLRRRLAAVPVPGTAQEAILHKKLEYQRTRLTM